MSPSLLASLLDALSRLVRSDPKNTYYWYDGYLVPDGY